MMAAPAPTATWKIILSAAAGASFAGVVGALVTDLGPWYYGLRVPPWKPPDWLFGPAWTFIFACAAWAGAYAWWGARTTASRAAILALFALNFAFNILWSWLFFRLQRPDYALVEVGLLWLSIAVLIVVLRRHSPIAGWLLAPYLAWVTFAAALNYAIVRLNAPF
jgi:tryptophan-rich sensory protein